MDGPVWTTGGCEKRVSLVSINSNKKGVLRPNGVNISLRQSPVRGRVACISEGRGKRVSSILLVFFFGELLVRN